MYMIFITHFYQYFFQNLLVVIFFEFHPPFNAMIFLTFLTNGQVVYPLAGVIFHFMNCINSPAILSLSCFKEGTKILV